jgi:hypothetical protein
MGTALVGFDVRRCARPESISKRAPSTTRTSLRLKSPICERPIKIVAHAADFHYPSSIALHINATIGFEGLSRRTKRPAKSLMRTLSPSGNPQARNLFEVVQHLQRAEGLQFDLSLARPVSH